MLNDRKPTSDDQPPGTESCALALDAETYSKLREITMARSLAMRKPPYGWAAFLLRTSSWIMPRVKPKRKPDPVGPEASLGVRDRIARAVQPLDTVTPFV